MKEPLIYLAGPYSDDPARRYAQHQLEQERLAAAGILSYSPIVEGHPWDQVYPHEYDWWLRRCLRWVRQCTDLIRLPGHSPGADQEVRLARDLGIPVYQGGNDPVGKFLALRGPVVTAEASE